MTHEGFKYLFLYYSVLWYLIWTFHQIKPSVTLGGRWEDHILRNFLLHAMAFTSTKRQQRYLYLKLAFAVAYIAADVFFK